MRILVISPFNIFPPWWGGSSRIYNIIKYLSKNNEIIFLVNNHYCNKTLDNESKELHDFKNNPNLKITYVKSFGRYSQIFNPLIIITGHKLIKNEKIDIILGEFLWSGIHSILLKYLTNRPFILDEHNIEYIRFGRINKKSKLITFIIRIYESICCKFSNKIFCVSELDKKYLVNNLNIEKDKIIIVPNGIDTNKFYPNLSNTKLIRNKLDIDEIIPVILFFGKLDYYPNIEALEIIYKILLPKLKNRIGKFKILIVGDNPPLNMQDLDIIYTGVVEKIEDYINVANIVICPLLSGGGTRIKILESLACNKIVISTNIGAEGIKNIPPKQLRIADDWDIFVEEILKALKSKKYENGLKEIKKYSWEFIIKQVEDALYDI